MANYPFCTIEPNKAIVPVPDKRLQHIADILKKENPIPARIEFTDIAGLVKGASKGEGLGNRFLGHVRNVDAIIHVVRCFSDNDVVHITGEIDPVSDIETINTELLLADMEILERASEKLSKTAKSGDKDSKKRLASVEKLLAVINSGDLPSSAGIEDNELLIAQEMGLLSIKPVLYVGNIPESDSDTLLPDKVSAYAQQKGAGTLFISGKIEEEISVLDGDEKTSFLEAMGINESGLDRLIIEAYRLLDLISYYTAATELQAWALKKGTTARKAAGKIHTDFEKGFIRAEVYRAEDLFSYGSEQKLKEAGLINSEGKDYIIKEGDVVKYLFNV